ncbi:MAG TPA: hypothetical protein PKC39_01250 [Ferruginibacter sp.]|nr:hypothetical protein [Ferruginibacter sp.]HMP19559.1 hypothetical protein [Ferruginibacter sp.]
MAYNTLNASLFDAFLDDDFVYESQMAFEPIVGKQNFVDYIHANFEAVLNSGRLIYAEIGRIGMSNQNSGGIKLLLAENVPCLLMVQGEKYNKFDLILFEFRNNKVLRMDLCTHVPHWSQALGTNDYPGIAV